MTAKPEIPRGAGSHLRLKGTLCVLCGTLAIVFALLLASTTSLAATKTTAPGRNVLVYFIFDDTRLAIAIYRESAAGGTSELAVEKYVVRGDFAKFIVINRSKKARKLSFMKRHLVVGPRKQVTFFYKSLLKRGPFVYSSPAAPRKPFSGVFLVR